MRPVLFAIMAATVASAETVTVKLVGATSVGTLTLDRGAANKTIGNMTLTRFPNIPSSLTCFQN